MTAQPSPVDILASLIVFDTTSRNSNLELIRFVQDYLTDLGVEARLTFDDQKRKANLYATLGPERAGGIVLSGHTDVVPVDGQDWRTDPFRATVQGDRVYGRGTADMKGFIACCLALAPRYLARHPKMPLHFSFSYDEEVGCVGVRRLIDDLKGLPVRPAGCIVGEPTEMRVVNGHKGKHSMRCTVRGREAHSALTPLGVNAVEAAAEVVARLAALARRLKTAGPFDDGFFPAYTTVQTGTIRGGTAVNIVPRECQFDFEVRDIPGQDGEALIAEIVAYVERELAPPMRAVSPDAGFYWESLSSFPPLETDPESDIVKLARELTGANELGKVSYGTEAGLFHQAGLPTVVCGPGSIEQAHRPNEFLAIEQLARCDDFLERLADRVARSEPAIQPGRRVR